MQPIILFSVSTTAGTPVYRQLIEQIQRLIVSGKLAPGQILPSIREVAKQLTINPMTVSKAYSLLENDGYLERCKGVGMRVLPVETIEMPDLLAPAVDELVSKARELGVTLDALQENIKANWEKSDE